jgi:hypothetical protein
MERKTALRKFDVLTGDQYLAAPSPIYFARLNLQPGDSYGQLEVCRRPGSDPGEVAWKWRSRWGDGPLERDASALFLAFAGPQIVVGATDPEVLNGVSNLGDLTDEQERRAALEDLLANRSRILYQGALFGGNRLDEYHLVLQDDGDLAVRKGTPENPGEPVWSSLVELDTEAEPPQVQDVKKTWSDEAKYDEMEIGETRLLLSLPNGKYVLLQGNQVDPKRMPIDIGEVHSGVLVTKNLLGPSFAIVAAGSILHVADTGSNDLSSVDFSLFTPEAKVQISDTYIGGGASLNLIDGKVSVFNIKLGAGVSSGIGITDDSVTFKLLGTGLQIGRVVSISALDNSFGIDFGRVFNSIG